MVIILTTQSLVFLQNLNQVMGTGTFCASSELNASNVHLVSDSLLVESYPGSLYIWAEIKIRMEKVFFKKQYKEAAKKKKLI